MKKILCVCLGNSDRSPVMAAVLAMYLKNAGHDVVVESAGVSEHVEVGASAAPFGVQVIKRLGLDISGHTRRRTTALNLNEYDLFVCATDEIAGELFLSQGVSKSKLHNAQVTNPWPVQFAEQYEVTFEQILVSMARVMKYYFPVPSVQ